jgi:hypothetical protein
MCVFANLWHQKQRYACFNCRQMFKFPGESGFEGKSDGERFCLHCGNGLYAMGLFFEVPAKSDKKQWKKVEILARNSYRFRNGCCDGPGYRPKTLREVPEFLGVPNNKRARKQFFRQYTGS